MNTLLSAALTAAVVGAGAAAVTIALTSQPSPAPALAAVDDGAARVAALASELELVRGENVELARRLAFLESRSDRVEARPAAPERAAELSLDEETRQLVAALTEPGREVAPQLEDTVRRALTSIREEEERERQRQAEQAAAERVDERLEELRTELGLNGYQTDRMRTAMLDFNAKRTELFQRSRDAGDWGSMREDFRDTFRSYREELEQILTPIQLEQYEDLDRGWGGRGGDDRRRRDA